MLLARAILSLGLEKTSSHNMKLHTTQHHPITDPVLERYAGSSPDDHSEVGANVTMQARKESTNFFPQDVL